MTKDETGRGVLRWYLAAEAVILIAIEIAEVTLPPLPVKLIMFSAIVLNTCVMLWIYTRQGRAVSDRWQNLLALGLAVNCLADVFLTVRGDQIPGFALFCTVEFLYAVYLKPDRTVVLIRAAVFALCLALAWSLGMLTFGNALGLFNLSLLGVNVVCAWLARRRERSVPSLLFACALTVFFLGDLSVAAELLASGLFQAIAAWLVWVFYVPAQVGIVLTYYTRTRPET